MDECEYFAKEERLHQAVVTKLSTGAPNLQILRSILPKTIGIKDANIPSSSVSTSASSAMVDNDGIEDYLIWSTLGEYQQTSSRNIDELQFYLQKATEPRTKKFLPLA
nr:uncharacterized protein LOC117276691 [Nicotiana tomentosiformis]